MIIKVRQGRVGPAHFKSHRQGILLLFKAAHEYFDPPTHHKIHLYLYDLIAF